MCNWYTIDTQRANATVTLAFQKSEDRFWTADILHTQPLPSEGFADQIVILTGSAANWMYAHAAAVACAQRASKVIAVTAHPPGLSHDCAGSDCRLIPAEDPTESAALFKVQLRASPALSSDAIDGLLRPALKDLRELKPKKLVIEGRANLASYVQITCEAVRSGCRWIGCWSARDGLIVIYDPDGNSLGHAIRRPDWLADIMPKPKDPVIIGVVGDPNRGKSVFSKTLDAYLQELRSEYWLLDCDGQAPTPAWFLSMLSTEDAEEAKRMRQENKVSWTPEMEKRIASQLRLAREIFPVLIADLPGGKHVGWESDRIPPGRERIFSEVDALILLDREDAPSEKEWRQALRPHGLESRIAAVLYSRDPHAPPSLNVTWQDGLWRGVVTGLERSHIKDSPAGVLVAFRPALDQLWPELLQFARRQSAASSSGPIVV